MKILSETLQNGRVVELTNDEWREFIILAAALEGKTEDSLYFDFRTRYNDSVTQKNGVDFSGVFGAILAFYEARFRANELHRLVDDLDAYLGKPNLPKKSERE
jgi:hypothetical protein